MECLKTFLFFLKIYLFLLGVGYSLNIIKNYIGRQKPTPCILEQMPKTLPSKSFFKNFFFPNKSENTGFSVLTWILYWIHYLNPQKYNHSLVQPFCDGFAAQCISTDIALLALFLFFNKQFFIFNPCFVFHCTMNTTKVSSKQQNKIW